MGVNLSSLPKAYQKQIRKSKYGNRKVTVNGIVFDSAKEADRYLELLALYRAGEIADLRLQPEFTLIEGFVTPEGERVRPERYKADFSYTRDGERIVEDVKGHRTKEYLIKRKQMLDRYGVSVREV